MTERTPDDWAKTILDKSASLAEAIKSMNTSMLQIVLVVDESNKLFGTITDGDIRRALLGGASLETGIEDVANKSPLVVSPLMSRDAVLELMKINRIHQLPVVDEDAVVVGLHHWDLLLSPEKRGNLMIVMAGGKGTRLRPHTENCPKPMLELGGKPMLEHIVERAKIAGISNFIFAIHYLGHMIEDYFGDGSDWGVKIEYLREETPLGTAGALSLMTNQTDDPILVTNGDVLTDVNYGEIVDYHVNHEAVATMAVRKHSWEHPFGVVKINGVDIVGFDEKPIIHSHINAGIYVLGPEALKLLRVNEYCDMPTLFTAVKENDSRVIVYPMHEPWLDVGRHDDLQLARDSHSGS